MKEENINKYIFLGILLFLTFGVHAQKCRVSGFIYDFDTHEKLIGATVSERSTTVGTTTNSNGYFSMKVDNDSVRFGFVGYHPQIFLFKSDTIVEIYLKPGTNLAEIKVVREKFKTTNVSKLSGAEIMQIPSVSGKPDVLKALQLTTGIETQAEGTSLLTVRGGSPGENLYLIDDVPLIHVNHIGGFISVFNPDMINSIDVYKGNFPAKYGGKLSSVLTISQREGNKKHWKGNFGLGVTDASFTVEGPIIEDTMSIIVTGRKTLIDYPMALLTLLSNDGLLMYYGFHDVNAKWSYKPNKTNSFHANLYVGDDYLNYRLIAKDSDGEKNKYKNNWGNYMLSGKWNCVLNNNLFVSNTVSTTRYHLRSLTKYTSSEDSINIVLSEYKSIVQDYSLRSDWQYIPFNQLKFDFGANASYIHNVPNKIIYSTKSVESASVVNGLEASVYESAHWNPIKNIQIDAGFRFVNYFTSGYNLSKIEPRLSASFVLGNHQINANYQKINQYSHLLMTSGSVFNNEVWITSDSDIPAAQSVQYGFSWISSYFDDNYSFEVNFYHKLSTNLATYKEGYSTLLGDGNWKNKVETGGIGASKGLEISVKKNIGEYTGFISYTLSKTTRQFPGINSGEEFIYNFDRPHSFSITLNKELNKKWNFTVAWIYQTGLPYTPVVGRSLIYNDDEESEVLIYGERNSARMKNYHRLDLAARYNNITKKGRRVEWVFSIYNAYNRKNANSYYYGYSKDLYADVSADEAYFKQYQNSFFPIIPNVSYKIYFDDIQWKQKKKQTGEWTGF